MQPLRALACAVIAFSSPAAAQMIGSYTVNPAWPAFPGNFVSLADATNALTAQGVVGPVWIDVYDDAGPYNEASPFVSANGPYAPNTAVLVMTSWTGASSTNRITFRAAPGESPVFDATGRAMGVFWGGADYVTIEGFEICNAPFDAISLYAEASHGVASDPIISRCRIHDCGGTGVTVYGNTPQPVNTLIQNCFFWRLQLTNTGSFNTTGRFGYITTRRSTNTRVVHNTFLVDTGAGSSFCAIGSYPSGATELPYGEISNNVILKTGAPGRPIFRFQMPATSTTPLPSICDSNCYHDLTASSFALHGSGAATVANTLLDWQIATLRDLASLNVDPQLRDIATQDFHVAVTSPCLGASTVNAGVTEDIDGQPRGTSLDIGADEFSAATIGSVGTGCAGTGSVVPVLWTNEWPFLGNQRFAVTTRQMPANLPMFVFASFGTTTTPFPVGAGCSVYLQLGSFTGIPSFPTSGPAGTASLVIPLPANAAFAGVNFGFQAMVPDSGAPLGLTVTNALDVVLGF